MTLCRRCERWAKTLDQLIEVQRSVLSELQPEAGNDLLVRGAVLAHEATLRRLEMAREEAQRD